MNPCSSACDLDANKHIEACDFSRLKIAIQKLHHGKNKVADAEFGSILQEALAPYDIEDIEQGMWSARRHAFGMPDVGEIERLVKIERANRLSQTRREQAALPAPDPEESTPGRLFLKYLIGCIADKPYNPTKIGYIEYCKRLGQTEDEIKFPNVNWQNL